MKLGVVLIFFTLLSCFSMPAHAVVPGIGPTEPVEPPLKIFGNKQKKTIQPSPVPGQTLMGNGIEDIHDIQGPIILPESTNFRPFIIIAALTLLLIGLIFFFIKKRQKSAPALPAHEIALAELAKAKAWMNKNKGLLYAQRLSEILRQYIESRFSVHSTRQTTAELLTTLQSDQTTADQINQHLDDLQICLEKCDMAKFAHLAPNDQSMAKMEDAVRHFIETTKPVQTAEETT